MGLGLRMAAHWVARGLRSGREGRREWRRGGPGADAARRRVCAAPGGLRACPAPGLGGARPGRAGVSGRGAGRFAGPGVLCEGSAFAAGERH